MSRKYPVGNCEPSNVYYEKLDPCRMNYITKHNKIRNSFNNIPRDLLIQENFNNCKEQCLVQPVLNVGSSCTTDNRWPHQWANLTPEDKGGYVMVVKKKDNEIIKPIMGKIEIPNYFQPQLNKSST